MKYKVCSVFDSKSKLYSNPAFFKTTGDAIRAFMEACKDEKTTVGKYPEDFTFFLLAEFDEELGEFRFVDDNKEDLRIALARGIDFKQ